MVQEVERYYEYRMRLRPGSLEVGQNYIIDKVTNTNDDTNKEPVTWYQFRIPIRQYDKAVGTPGGQEFGFKYIRFLRMYMTGWQQPVVLRLVQPQFVANQWRRYLYQSGRARRHSSAPDTDADAFSISTVSIEENGRTAAVGNPAIPYVLPPGIRATRSTARAPPTACKTSRACACAWTNLRDGFAKAAYKNMTHQHAALQAPEACSCTAKATTATSRTATCAASCASAPTTPRTTTSTRCRCR